MWAAVLFISLLLIGLTGTAIFGGNKELVHGRKKAPHWPPKIGDEYKFFHRFANKGEKIVDVGHVTKTGANVNVRYFNGRSYYVLTNTLERNPETGEVWEWRSNMGENEALVLN